MQSGEFSPCWIFKIRYSNPASERRDVREVPADGTGTSFLARDAYIVFVIIHHAAQAYGPTGGAWPVHDRAHSDWFRPFYLVNSAFGLGLLFLFAGYFVPRSYERNGPRRFLKERWAGIGVPLVIFALMIHLPLAYLFKSRPEPAEFIRWLYESGWQPLYLHLWFLCHILLYSAVYLLWHELVVRSEQTPGVCVAHAVGEWDHLMGAGGLNLSSLVRNAWETVICAGLSIGLIILFREVFHRRYRLLVAMATASFAAYILHLAIVIALQAGIVGLALPAVVKFALVAAIATVLAFGIAHLSSKVPGLRSILGTPSAGTRSTGLSGTAS
jgi:fucose 4-O-acetylase-like acetyltransferase